MACDTCPRRPRIQYKNTSWTMHLKPNHSTAPNADMYRVPSDWEQSFFVDERRIEYLALFSFLNIKFYFGGFSAALAFTASHGTAAKGRVPACAKFGNSQ